jgi:hypothetical protein
MDEKICRTCRHYREIEGRKDGVVVTEGYCHASRNFAHRKPEDTCRRWNYKRTL